MRAYRDFLPKSSSASMDDHASHFRLLVCSCWPPLRAAHVNHPSLGSSISNSRSAFPASDRCTLDCGRSPLSALAPTPEPEHTALGQLGDHKSEHGGSGRRHVDFVRI